MVKPRNPKLVANGMDSQNAILFVGTDNRLLSRREAAQQPCVCVCGWCAVPCGMEPRDHAGLQCSGEDFHPEGPGFFFFL